ncbi:MAG: DUF4395 domain-containing protein [Chlorobiaceae bacterium]|nr:DUF4395 domain-containing protein [Chlorobiaceae bacterium]NTV61577.1 DUF4395 domain-containing protein [Chlorobiaceae bacterium]
MSAPVSQTPVPGGIPVPIVKLNQSILVGGVILGILFQQPLITTALFLILLGAVIFGKKGSLIFFIGSRILAEQIKHAPAEDPKLQRFNNSIAATLLGSAQAAFLLGAPLAGWILSGMVAAAATAALSGFCLGCFLYYQFNIQRYKFFGGGKNNNAGAD